MPLLTVRFIVILPDMAAGSCGLRRLFTSLYSMPSFLTLLGAASLELSLQQMWQHHIYCFHFDYMQIFLREMVLISAVGLQNLGQNKCIHINYQEFKPTAALRPTCCWSSAGLQRAAASWRGSCLDSAPERLPAN